MATLTKLRFEPVRRLRAGRPEWSRRKRVAVNDVVSTSASGMVLSSTKVLRLHEEPASQTKARLALQGQLPGPGANDWLRTVGMIPDDEVTREVNAEAERIRRSR
jgi:hypothetical protein